MRIKSRPGKPRLFQIVPQPSIMALHSLSHQFSSPTTHLEQSHGNNEANEDDSYAHCSIVPESCDDGGQNKICQKQTHNAIDDMAVEEELRGKSPDAMCRTLLETSNNGGQITSQKQTPIIVDDMVVEKVPRGKSPDAMCSTLPETSNNGGQNTSPQKQTPNIVDDMVVEEEFHVKAPDIIHATKACSEINWSEKEVCIKCEEGGKLLVCSDSNCPLAVHEGCIRCSAHFDSKGNFFCPYCSYKQVVLATRKARKKAMLAKKALSVFLDRGKLDGVPPNEKVDGVKHEKTNLPENEEANNCCDRVQENCPAERTGREFGTNVVSCDGATSSAVNEQNNVIGKCMETGKSVDGREETENRTVTEQATESVRGKTPKTIDNFQNETMVQHDQEEAVTGKNRKLIVEPGKPMEGSLADGETEEENPKIVYDFQNKRVKQRDQKTYVMEGKAKLGFAPEKSMNESLDKDKAEIEEEPKIVDDFQNNKRVEQHDQETSSIGIIQKLGVEPEESVESLDDTEIEEDENLKIVNGSQNTRVESHDREASVIGKDPKLSGEPEKEAMEDLLDDTETEKEVNPKIDNNSQNKRVEQHDQEASVTGKKTKLGGGELEKSMEGKLENAGIEKEEIQNQEQESSGPASEEEDPIEEHDVASDLSDGVSEVVLRSSRRIRKKNQNVNSENGEGSRKKAREQSFEEDGNKVKKEKSITKSKSRQPIANTGFPNMKRKRMPWTAEEEEMLKEGVGRFSSKVNKNLPWKKILDFGRHVFHRSRTPDNLKDKWRNQMR